MAMELLWETTLCKDQSLVIVTEGQNTSNMP